MGSAFEVRELVWRLGSFELRVPELAIPTGRTTALLGRSASGKSTLLSLLGRVEGSYFERPEGLSGEIWFSGAEERLELLGLTERELLKRRLRGPVLGFVFQREGLFPHLSPAENVTWPLEAAGVARAEASARAERMLARVGLAPGRTVATLSGGERKRLALARALAFEPRVLLLDEPLTGLDPEALEGLLDLLAEIAADRGRTIVIVTHQERDVARLAEHVVFMDGGEVAASGPREAMNEAIARFFAGRPVDELTR
ncbi:MAG: ABC transporter ATP-binding protein [Myxococcales bacterium]|nr:ABC transporter ATP-binding protein [Myxococcales bacterium]MCB9734321.1 ABC transporter ATP-binding protein [Deltaproteobacteria bacterium]